MEKYLQTSVPRDYPRIPVPNLKGWRAEVGILSPGAGLEREWEIVAPEGVKFARVILLENENAEVDGLLEMNKNIEREAKKLNNSYRCDVICLCCTAASFAGGPGYDQQIIARIEQATGSPATTTSTCVTELFRDMNIKRAVLVGPYTDRKITVEIEFFAALGIELIYRQGSGLQIWKTTEYRDFSVDPYAGYRLVKEGAKYDPSADAVFLTCMASPILGVADILEEEIGKPVISSPSATLYGILKKVGIPDPVYGYGVALRRPRLKDVQAAKK